MSKEIYIATTPHETRLAIVEDDQLAEVYFERENEYTLAGSIYKGKVTRVLPGMQSSFVDVGLERDAFLYVTDFMEEQGDSADFESEAGHRRSAPPREEGRPEEGRREGRREGGRGARSGRRERREPTEPVQETTSFDEPIAPMPVEEPAGGEYDNQAALDGQGSRRWRGRRGRRRGRGGREDVSNAEVATGTYAEHVEPEFLANGETVIIEGSSEEEDGNVSTFSGEGSIQIDLNGAEELTEAENLGRRNVHRPGRVGRPGSEDRLARQQRPEPAEADSDDRRGRGRSSRRPDRRTPEPFAADSTQEATAAGTPVVLPGESIRKYRDPAELAAEAATQPAKASAQAITPVVSSRPSVEIVGWDGSGVLPGESLARHRKSGRPAAAPAESRRDEKAAEKVATAEALAVAAPVQERSEFAQTATTQQQEIPETASVAVEEGSSPSAAEEIPAPAAPEETGGLTHEVHAAEFGHAGDVDQDAQIHEAVAAAEEAVPTPSAGEYEPTEGESATFGDRSRQNLRRLAQRPEPEESPVEVAAINPEVADRVEAEPAAEAKTRERQTFTDDVELQDAVAGTELGASFDTPSQEPSGHEFSSIQADGSMVTNALQDAEEDGPRDEFVASFGAERHDETQGQAEAIAEIHGYGDGDFHEEEVDGDEFEYDFAARSEDDEDFDDYEEETLEGTADLGSVIHEIDIDGQTQPSDEEEDEADESEPADASGGFTVNDFGGEPSDAGEEEPSDRASSGNRRGGRDSRRGSRDRGARGERPFRGGAGADRGRGRGRQSVQTMDLPAITDLLKPGQEVLVQIAKEPIAKKGARITSHIALPGRFLVFMPTVNHTGVSRKISSDEERRRLKSILLSEKGDAQGGFIVRTAAEGASEEELRNDLRFLIQLWQHIKTRSDASKSPALIYHDLGLIERILRDQVTDNFSAIWVDSEQEYERVLRFLQRFQPSLVRRVKLYTKETPMFEHFGITTEIDKALKSKVWLKSGGSIVINQTEALVAIDINTGKYVGKTARLEDTILKTNLDAIPEIVRQIRLRDLGGIIVIDFIDMDERKNRARVMQALEDELKSDRAPSKVLPFNDFGLVIMTRKRVKQSLERTLCMPDPVTEGTGMIKSPVTVSNEIYVEMRKMYRHMDKGDILLRVHPEVVKQLKSNGARRLQELEEMTHKTILLKSDPALSPEQFDIH